MKGLSYLRTGCIILVIWAAFIVLISLSACADTITVAKDGNGDYETIQDAIDNASPGDTIEVWEGEYQENIAVNKNVDLIGNGSDVTTIHGGWTGDVVSITTDWVNMSGFRLIHGGERTPNSMIRIESDHNYIFENQCEVEKGYGIGLFNANENVLMNNNISRNEGTSIYLEGSQWNTVHTNELEESKIGVSLFQSNNNGVHYNNCSKTTEAGIRIEDSTDNAIWYNDLSRGNSVGLNLQGAEWNVIRNNTMYQLTTGLWFNTGSDHNTIEGNHITHCSSSGITLSESSNNSIRKNIITHNPIGIELNLPSPDNEAHHNNISSNVNHGIYVWSNNERTINASFNWWGHDSGPYHETKNPGGEGDNVTDYVIFEPFIRDPEYGPTAVIVSITPESVSEGTDILFIGSGFDDGTIVQYAWRSSINGEFYNDTGHEFTYSDLTNGSHTIYLRVMDNEGHWSQKTFQELLIYVPPVADAGTDREIITGTRIIFDGSGSSDAGGIEGWTWSFHDGGPQELIGVDPGYRFYKPGDFLITLTVINGVGHTAIDHVTIKVTGEALIFGSVHGRVTNGTGAPVGGAVVTIEPNYDITDPDGYYMFHRVQVGAHVITVEKDIYAENHRSISLDEGEVQEENFEMTYPVIEEEPPGEKTIFEKAEEACCGWINIISLLAVVIIYQKRQL